MRLRFRQIPMAAKIGVGVVIFAALSLFYGMIGKALLDNRTPDAGHTFWGTCIAIQYLLVCLVAPVVTANCITQEKEQQTWEMLIFTRLTPAEIILGKLVSRLAIVFLGLALFFPMTVFCWLHSAILTTHIEGTSRIGEFVMTYAVIVISAIFYATVGLFISWQMKKTIFAIMVSYTVVIGFLFLGTGLVYWMLQSRFTDSTFTAKFPLLWVNPLYLIGYAMSPDNSSNSNLFVVYGLLCYVVASVALLWRMIAGFYHVSDDDDDGAGDSSLLAPLFSALIGCGRHLSGRPKVAVRGALQTSAESNGDGPADVVRE